MQALTLERIAEFTGGQAKGTGLVDHVTIDSRLTKPNGLFVALPGEKVDGHDFVPEVLEKGGFALVKKGTYSQAGVIEVDDPLTALQELARAYLGQFPIPVVAITGSNGKTSTKDMIAQVLRARYSVYSTQGSYNNEIGVPLTILGLEEEHEILVVEMGMRGLGQIRSLAEICPPTLGVITNIGPVHLELLGSMGNIAQAKGELLEALTPEGVAVLNGDDPSVRGQARNFEGRVIYYGLDLANDLIASKITLDREGQPSFRVRAGEEKTKVRMGIPGVHNVWNACAALAVGFELGVPLEQGAQALKELSLSEMRLEVERSPQGVTIVNDSYNASPASTRVALDTLVQMYCKGQRVAILGDMLELGEIAIQAHREMGAYARNRVNRLVFIGQYASTMHDGAGCGEVFSSVEEFLASEFLVAEGDLVLVKASRSLHFERIVEKLKKGRER